MVGCDKDKTRINWRRGQKIAMTSVQLLKEQSKYLKSILDALKNENSLSNKRFFLEQQEATQIFLQKPSFITDYYSQSTEQEKFVLASIATIGQALTLFQVPEHLSDTKKRFQKLIEQLISFENFYQEIGGILGYHLKVIDLLCEKEEHKASPKTKKISQAPGISLHENLEIAEKAAIDGIKSLPLMGEMYPIGGAGDRLNLTDEKTGIALPTAKLNFLGESLLSHMIQDLQAREYVHYKIYGSQLVTPIAMMTSAAKNNHQFVQQICSEKKWYHRPETSYFLFEQPLAPVLTTEGQWALLDKLQLFLKPSGHGVIWKLARDLKVFDWFRKQGREKGLIRQMNNPMAGVDLGILALIGLGCKTHKSFGFASCQRLVQAAEGVNVLVEENTENSTEYAISNIEYTEFDKYHLEDRPSQPSSRYSLFPANTNILFIDFLAVENALEKCPIPGMLINMKTEVPIIDESGNKHLVKGGRLESTMQNIADLMTQHLDSPKQDIGPLELSTFLTYNRRRKTISVAKKSYRPGQPIQETPEGCYYTLLQNNFDLFSNYCNFSLPPIPPEEDFIKAGPNAHLIFHPSLGPLYSIIAQKVQNGRLHHRAEMVLKIAELEIKQIEVAGSLIIEAKCPMGHLNEKDLLQYSNRSGKCTLINVNVHNKGIDYSKEPHFSKGHIEHLESLSIYLEENAEFFAQDVTFSGDFKIHVPQNTRVIAHMQDGEVIFDKEVIASPTWHWKYEIIKDSKIRLIRDNARN